MKGTEKNLAGPAIVIGIILLAALGTGLTWVFYSADHPSAVRAEVVDEKTVTAEFSATEFGRIVEGSKAIISYNGARSTGIVKGRESAEIKTLYRVTLLQPFVGAPAGAPCQVTVDLTLPPEPLKESPSAP